MLATRPQSCDPEFVVPAAFRMNLLQGPVSSVHLVDLGIFAARPKDGIVNEVQRMDVITVNSLYVFRTTGLELQAGTPKARGVCLRGRHM